MTSEHGHLSPAGGAPGSGRPVALATGVGRTAGIGAAIAGRLAAAGWDIAFTYWTAYDQRMAWGAEEGAAAAVGRSLARHGAAAAGIEADLADPGAAEQVFSAAEEQLGTSPRWCCATASPSTPGCSTRPWRASTATSP